MFDFDIDRLPIDIQSLCFIFQCQLVTYRHVMIGKLFGMKESMSMGYLSTGDDWEALVTALD